MKVLVLVLSLLLTYSISVFASSSGGENHGLELVPALFANQTTQNNASNASYRVTTTETDLHIDLGYNFGFLYAGAVYYYGVVDAVNYSGNNTENKTTLQWAGPAVGISLGNFLIRAGYVLYANDSVYNFPSSGSATTYNYTSGTGPFGSIAYNVHLSNTFYLAPTIDVYDITFTIGQTGGGGAAALARNYEITGIAPFLGLGIHL